MVKLTSTIEIELEQIVGTPVPFKPIVIPDGVAKIYRLLASVGEDVYNLFSTLSGWRWDWELVKTQDPKNYGRLSTRIAKHVKNSDLSDDKKAIVTDLIPKIAEIARDNLSEAPDQYLIDFTNRFDWDAGGFGDDGSCFWGEFRGARESMMAAGCLAVRFWKPWNHDDRHLGGYKMEFGGKWYRGYARAWIIPGDLMNDSGQFIMFNSYGIQSDRMAKILAAYFGLSTTIVKMRHGQARDLYINNDGYVFGQTSESLTRDYEVNWETIGFRCANCGDWAWSHEGDGEVCDECTDGATCSRCGNYVHTNGEDSYYLESGDEVCQRCYDNYGGRCEICDNVDYLEYLTCTEDEVWLCEHCAEEARQCTGCSALYHDDNLMVEAKNGSLYCTSCADRHLELCPGCGERVQNDDMETFRGESYCSECFDKAVADATEEEEEEEFEELSDFSL